MSSQFAEYNALDLSDVNKKALEKWQNEAIFKKSIAIRQGSPSYIFYEGPPSANGMPGIHHVIARSIKDIFCRYKTMKGYRVERKAGWDTHGLPVELGVEKKLGITKEDIGKKISIADYNRECRIEVMKYTKEWEELTEKMGYWVDMEHPYITCDNRYVETLWWLLKQLYEKGLLYKGYTIQPYSPAAGTGLSSHELNQPGCYRDVKDRTCVAMFPVKNESSNLQIFESLNVPVYFLAWTTTPWTLPSNTALCIGTNIIYNFVKAKNPYSGQECVCILAKERVSAYFGEKKIEDFEIVGEVSGKDLVGMEYEQLIPFMNPLLAEMHGCTSLPNAFRVISGDFVTTEDGTGIVHIAPTFGADDDRAGKQNGIVPMLLVDKNGKQTPMVDLTGKFYKIEALDENFVKNNVNVELYKNYAGKFVKDAYYEQLSENHISLDDEICIWLKQQGLLFKSEKHTHSYPHCWRTDKPVLYYPLDSWFIRSTACRDEMIALNNTINWKPQSTGSGRFGKWLENLQDWNLSRSRYWGTPLPIWRTEDGMEEKCISSVEQLCYERDKAVSAGYMQSNPYKEAGFMPGVYTEENYNKIDLHRPYVDEITLVSEKGQPMMREPDLIDVWFDSGSMPYAQVHYPFENKEAFDSGEIYPADFIAEGVDQTRGWFFTLHAIASMVFDSVSFKNVISNGLVLDKNGNKMSKRLGNAVDPFETIEKYGSDPLRWYMITNASPWENLKFDIDGIEEVRRKFFGTLYNTYSFFALYANVDGFRYSEPDVPMNERPEIDRWILSLLNTLIRDVDAYYADYEPTRAGRAISDFVNDHLSNWYVRLNRRRFWGGGMTTDKLSAYQTLYTCLETISKLMAPVAPFYSDRLFIDLTGVTGKDRSESVHLADFPEYRESVINKLLEERMQLAQTISSMVLALRRKVSIKVRQPLQSVMIPALNDTQKTNVEAVKSLILNEVNVKELKFVDSGAGILVKKIKPDFKKLGPRYGKIMKQLASAIQTMSQEEIATFEKTGVHSFEMEGQKSEITREDVEIISEDIPGWLVANEDNITIALDVTVTEDLRKEGIARELVNRIQNLRKSSGLDITDKIRIRLSSSPETDEAIREYEEYITKQVLAVSLEIVEKLNTGTELDFDDFKLFAHIRKTNN
jgi:isoleucyl-tRNA synthetase